MTIKQALESAEGKLKVVGISSSRLDSHLLLEHITGRDRAWLMTHEEEELSQKQRADFEALVSSRTERHPLVHLTNSREFYGLNLYINKHVLTPRVETEQMVEWAIKYAPQSSRLGDIGTGSGAIALAIKKHRPDMEVWGTDVTDESLAVAQKNASILSLDVKFVKSDLFDGFQGSTLDTALPKHFATVCTNLPYLADSAKDELMPEVQHEPAVALFGGTDGLDLYRRFLKQLPNHLEPGGYLFTECDPWQQESLTAEATKINLKAIEQNYFILGFKKL